MKLNDIIKCEIIKIEKYGIFVKLDSYTGLIHISEISHNYIEKLEDIYEVGQVLNAEIIKIDEEKKQLNLSLKRKLKKEFKLEETEKGFKTLEEMLPIWIDREISK